MQGLGCGLASERTPWPVTTHNMKHTDSEGSKGSWGQVAASRHCKVERHWCAFWWSTGVCPLASTVYYNSRLVMNKLLIEWKSQNHKERGGEAAPSHALQLAQQLCTVNSGMGTALVSQPEGAQHSCELEPLDFSKPQPATTKVLKLFCSLKTIACVWHTYFQAPASVFKVF